MDADLKKILKAVVLAIRHSLEGKYNETGIWQQGDLESRLAEIGVRQDRESVPAEEMPNLTSEDQHARRVVDGYLKLRLEAGVSRNEAVREFVRESAYTWANRLLALRCMEARELIDEAILQKSTYGGRSLEHYRLIQRNRELSETPDDGQFAMLTKVFTEQAKRLPNLFDPSSPSIALRPSPAALQQCLDWLSGSFAVRSQPAATDEVFQAPDSLGWAYQYWNTDEKKRVFDMVKTVKGAKISGADIVPATQLYTDDYMVKFLVQNSLGATWRGMYPESNLGKRIEGDKSTEDALTGRSVWEYYVEDADRVPVKKKSVREITLLDPACGSGHFLIEAFDMFYDMYVEEGVLSEPSAICSSILENNLFGIDIDLRAIQIAEVALWMKAAERVAEFEGAPTGLVAAVASHLKGESWERFLDETFIDEPSVPRVLRKFALAMTNIDQLGTLARPAEELEEIIREEHETWEKQQAAGKESNFLFSEMLDDVLAGQLPFKEMSDEQFGHRMMNRAIFAIDGFTQDARDRQEFEDSLLGSEAKRGFRLLQLLDLRYDVVVANPPYMGTSQCGTVVRDVVTSFQKSPDLYCAFLSRAVELINDTGRSAMVTRADYLTQAESQKIRQFLLKNTSTEILVNLGNKTFKDLSNPNAMFFAMIVYAGKNLKTNLVTMFDTNDATYGQKAIALRRSIERKKSHQALQITFRKLPRQSFAIQLPQWALDAYQNHSKFRQQAYVKQGLSTGDTSRFLRYKWELPSNSIKRWFAHAKGGEFRRWYGNDVWAVDWESSGNRLRNFLDHSTGKRRSVLRSARFYGKRGATWSSQTVSAFGVRILEPNSVFDTTGSSFFPKRFRDNSLLKMLAITNTPAFGAMFRAIQPGVHFGEGYLKALPFPSTALIEDQLVPLVKECISRSRKLARLNITSALFRPLVRDANLSIIEFAIGTVKYKLQIELGLHVAERRIWKQVEELLGIPRIEQSLYIRRRCSNETKHTGASDLFDSHATPTAPPQVASQTRIESFFIRSGLSASEIRGVISSLDVRNIPQGVLVSVLEDLVSASVCTVLGYRWPKTRHKARVGFQELSSEQIFPFESFVEHTTLAANVR